MAKGNALPLIALAGAAVYFLMKKGEEETSESSANGSANGGGTSGDGSGTSQYDELWKSLTFQRSSMDEYDLVDQGTVPLVAGGVIPWRIYSYNNGDENWYFGSYYNPFYIPNTIDDRISIYRDEFSWAKSGPKDATPDLNELKSKMLKTLKDRYSEPSRSGGKLEKISFQDLKSSGKPVSLDNLGDVLAITDVPENMLEVSYESKDDELSYNGPLKIELVRTVDNKFGAIFLRDDPTSRSWVYYLKNKGYSGDDLTPSNSVLVATVY